MRAPSVRTPHASALFNGAESSGGYSVCADVTEGIRQAIARKRGRADIQLFKELNSERDEVCASRPVSGLARRFSAKRFDVVSIATHGKKLRQTIQRPIFSDVEPVFLRVLNAGDIAQLIGWRACDRKGFPCRQYGVSIAIKNPPAANSAPWPAPAWRALFWSG
jgi:hypothetical protein